MTSQHRQKGDTIVEVLIAVAILSIILVTAFATINRAQNRNRAAQERGEALKTAQSQIEGLKALLVSGSTLPSGGPHCILLNSGTNKLEYVLSSNPSCQQIDNLYAIEIEETATTDTFKVRASWDRIGGGNENLEIYYRTYD